MYRARITRKNPTAFIIFIDQSGSMEEFTMFNNQQMTKAEAVALAVNMMITELINRSRKDTGYADYFEIAVFGYHGNEINSLLPSSKKIFMTPSQLVGSELSKIKINKERILPDGRSMVSVVEQKIWVQPFSGGKTPMYEALLRCYDIVKKWCADKRHRHSYPPTIFNITDGEASDGDDRRLSDIAGCIKELSTMDGNALMMNIHISTNINTSSVLFARDKSELPDENYARLLYDMSSVMPDIYGDSIAGLRGDSQRGIYRGISYNAGMTDLVSMMNIGSVTVNLLD